jgi:hypothetical protein
VARFPDKQNHQIAARVSLSQGRVDILPGAISRLYEPKPRTIEKNLLYFVRGDPVLRGNLLHDIRKPKEIIYKHERQTGKGASAYNERYEVLPRTRKTRILSRGDAKGRRVGMME